MKSKNLELAIQILVSTALGFSCGWIIEKSNVYQPATIRKQMIFQDFILFKFFFAALATSTLAILLISIILKKSYNAAYEKHQSTLKYKSLAVIILGSFLLGMGIQIAGASPIIVPVQLGAGFVYSAITFVGGLCGALVYGLCNPNIIQDAKGIASETIFSKNPALARSIAIVILGIIVFLMEYFMLWTKENNTLPVSVYGMLLGTLQFFSILFLNKSLGISIAYSTLVALPFVSKTFEEKYPYFAKLCTFDNLMTVIFFFSILLGSFVSSYTSGLFAKSLGIHPYNAFLGGFLIILGARMADGCTIEHGISGSAFQFIGSFVAIISIFLSAVIIGFHKTFNTQDVNSTQGVITGAPNKSG